MGGASFFALGGNVGARGRARGGQNENLVQNTEQSGSNEIRLICALHIGQYNALTCQNC
jgi:hypothetical protein